MVIERLEVAWILEVEEVNLICESFHSVSFDSVPLKCNRVALALASVANGKDEAFSWFE